MVEQDLANYGSVLRETREKCGVSLRHISSTTKISMSALEALESGDLEKLPGGIFTRSFVRAYAREIGLDPGETVKTFLSRSRGRRMNRRDSILESEYLGERWHPNRLWVAFKRYSLIVGILFLFLLIVVLAGLGEGDVDQAGRRNDDQIVNEVMDFDTADKRTVTERSSPAVFGEENVSEVEFLEIVVRPTDDCWISAVLDGERRVSRLLRGDEWQRLEAEQTISLTIGDARTCLYEVNNQTGIPLGGDGEVVSVTINVDNFRDFIEK